MELPLQPLAWRRLPLHDACLFSHERNLPRCIGGLGGRSDAIRRLTVDVRRGSAVALLQDTGLYQEFKDARWPNGDTPDGERFTACY